MNIEKLRAQVLAGLRAVAGADAPLPPETLAECVHRARYGVERGWSETTTACCVLDVLRYDGLCPELRCASDVTYYAAEFVTASAVEGVKYDEQRVARDVVKAFGHIPTQHKEDAVAAVHETLAATKSTEQVFLTLLLVLGRVEPGELSRRVVFDFASMILDRIQKVLGAANDQ